jgi:hypothetical protein
MRQRHRLRGGIDMRQRGTTETRSEHADYLLATLRRDPRGLRGRVAQAGIACDAGRLPNGPVPQEQST